MIAAVLLMALAPLPSMAGEGFGKTVFTKKVATLTRVSPPKVYLMGTRIAVKATGQSPGPAEVAARAQSQLESELLSADSRLSADSAHPQTLIEVTVTQNDYKEDWETRRVSRTRQAGKDSKGRPVYESYEADARFKVVKYHFTATYKVTDLAQRRNLDSDSIQSNFEQAFEDGNGAPGQGSLENTGVQMVVSRVVTNLTPTRERIGVLLPKGSLEDYLRLAEAGLWNKYLEALQGVPAKAKPEDDAYRKYAIGTAYEALGYNAESEETTLKYLEQAADYYNQALETNPQEKFFSQGYDSIVASKKTSSPLERVQSALVSYRKLKEFKDNYAKSLSVSADASSASVSGGKSLPSDPGTMNNAAVIKMMNAGLSEDIILTSINSAAKHSFDVSPDGLVALSQAQVSPRIIQRIQEFASGKGGTKTSAKAKTAKPKGSKPQ
jgi:tetratricopeptide (TPR) repeat protein